MPTRARANGFGFQQGHRFLGGQSFKPSGSGEAAETAANYGVINDLGEGFGRCAKVYRPGAVGSECSANTLHLSTSRALARGGESRQKAI